MPNIVEVNYKQTGESTKINKLGMQEMQERAYQARDARYLLLKAPPAKAKLRFISKIFLGVKNVF